MLHTRRSDCARWCTADAYWTAESRYRSNPINAAPEDAPYECHVTHKHIDIARLDAACAAPGLQHVLDRADRKARLMIGALSGFWPLTAGTLAANAGAGGRTYNAVPLHLRLMPAAGMSELPPLALLTLLRGLGSLVGISRGSAAGTLAATVQGDGVTVVDANSQVSGFCRSTPGHACLPVVERRPVAKACTAV
jgi:hypothetical protein